MFEIITVELSKYPALIEVANLARAGKACAIPVIGKPFDKVRVKSCKKTIDQNVYLITLVDDYMFYLVDDVNGITK